MAGLSPPLLRLVLLCFLMLPGLLAATYNGKLVGTLVNTANHKVSGTVYAVNGDTLRLVNFNYDGLGPEAKFYVGTTAGAPVVGGTTIPDETGSTNKLGAYTNRNILIKLPAGINMENLRWLSVWCVLFSMDFGYVTFPTGFKKPGPVLLGQFGLTNPRAHGFRSGNVIALDSKTISIDGIHYDGLGPDAFFILDTDLPVGHSGYDKLKDENNSTSRVKRYNGQNIVLVLPSGISIHSYKYLSMYCIRASADFGNLPIPPTLDVPLHPVTLQEETKSKDGSSQLDNCESMSDDFNVGWSVNTTHITFEFVSTLADGDYMAFGLSGSTSGALMIGGDVIVARFTNGNPFAVDHYLQAYSQCSVNSGACPDTYFTGGTQDARVIGGSKVDGVARVMVTRLLDTSDPKDIVYTPSLAQQIIWALGGLNKEFFPTKHDQRITTPKTIKFGRTPQRNCGNIVAPTTTSSEVWKETTLRGNQYKEFHVKIGPPAGDKGYKAITGQQSWGIAYYIEGYLIPVLELKRGENFTFIIEAGHDPANPAEYHPFYITEDPSGGFTQKSPAERAQYRNFLGIDDTTQLPVPNAVGPYCEYKSSGGLEAEKNSATFEEFKKTLSSTCETTGAPSPGRLNFYVDPLIFPVDSTVYYHCYTHLRLGHKIKLVDEYSSALQPLSSIPSIVISLIMCLIGYTSLL